LAADGVVADRGGRYDHVRGIDLVGLAVTVLRRRAAAEGLASKPRTPLVLQRHFVIKVT